jgi:hypothetical protein
MITEIYTFSPGSYVVAEEWNGNFRTLYQTSLAHEEAIQDYNNAVAYPNSDFTTIFESVKSKPDSWSISGDTVEVAPEQEYYKILSNSQNLNISIPDGGLNGETRILIQIPDLRTDFPFTILNYNGQKQIYYGDYKWFNPGFYYIFIAEGNGILQVKLIEIGA